MKWIRCQIIWNRTLPKICRFADLADLKLNDIYLIFDFFHWNFPFWILGESSNCTRFTMYRLHDKGKKCLCYHVWLHNHSFSNRLSDHLAWLLPGDELRYANGYGKRLVQSMDSKPRSVISSTRTVNEKTSPSVRRCQPCSSGELQLNCAYDTSWRNYPLCHDLVNSVELEYKNLKKRLAI